MIVRFISQRVVFASDFGGGRGGMPPRGPQLRAERADGAPQRPIHAAQPKRQMFDTGFAQGNAAHQMRAPMHPQMSAPNARPVNPKMQLAAQKSAEKAALKAAQAVQKTALKAEKVAIKAAKRTAQKAAKEAGLRAQPSPLKLPPAPKFGGQNAAPRQAAAMPAMGGHAPHAPHRALQNGVRRDPAPSRMSYRLQRLWLTPLFRAFARVGVPVFVVVLGLGLWLGDDGRRADIVGRYDDVVRKIQERPEFMVSLLKVDGASPEVDTAIRAMMPVKLPASSFQIDLDALHEVITRLDAVAEAKLVIRADGVLDVAVTERQPAVLWRHATGIEMLDATGHRVATLLDRAARPDLPLIAGDGAEGAVTEALELLAASGPILSRARGMVRVGERRWDIILDRGQTIMLPQENPVLAIERLLAIDAAEDLMGRDFTHLDLRNQDRPTIRLSEAALTEFRTIKGIETKVSQ